ncbi:hypothetical protein FM104_06345 [Microbacterium esteraromaticum]|uniref:Uncharacterized protein n=1 Tax=Microbacterium esteraromaticum TaxID=57043 RepID=A0A1R4JAX3_9MICO|nr:hypothetical protein [Microbacterium esteraromaticum]SJN29074.1 hypothetical protein FM104_06345 [Microbacterium esteraromaticum]
MLLFGDTTPMPTPSMTVHPDSVTPGFAGFAIVVLIVIAVILLIWDMNRRIRRVRYREEVREELDAEQAATEQSSADAAESDEVGDGRD